MTRRLPDDVDIDWDARSLRVAGIELPVASATHSPPSMQTHRVTSIDVVDGQLVIEREPLPTPQPRAEAYHFNVYAGESGHWIELSVWPSDDHYDVGMSVAIDMDPIDFDDDATAADVLRVWREAAARFTPPPDDYDAAAGFGPGTWWDEGS